MRFTVIILVIVLALLGAVFWNFSRTTREKMAVASNEVVIAQAQVTQIKEQAEMNAKSLETKTKNLESEVTRLCGEKTQAEQALAGLSNRLEHARQQAEQQQMKVQMLEQNKEKLTEQITMVSNQLAQVQQKLAALETAHTTTVGHLTIMRQDYVALKKDKAALEVRLNDLKALQAQIRLVKQEEHARKVEEWRRTDRAETALGNGGFLMKQGVWVRPSQTGSYPLTQEIRREP